MSEDMEKCIKVGEEYEGEGSVVYYYLPDIRVLGLMKGTESYIYCTSGIWKPDILGCIVDRIMGILGENDDEILFRADIISETEAHRLMEKKLRNMETLLL